MNSLKTLFIPTLFVSLSVIIVDTIIIDHNHIIKNKNGHHQQQQQQRPTTIPLSSFARRQQRQIIQDSFGSNPYLPMNGKEMNFLLLRNGMTRMITPTSSYHQHSNMNLPSSSSSSIVQQQRPTISSQQFRSDQHVVQYQQQQPSQIPSLSSKQSLSLASSPPQHAVFQPPPPNFKPNIAIENNLEFDLQSDSSRDNNEQWPSSSLSASNNDQPKITFLDVKCDRNSMKVSIHFDKPFHGVIFSKGHYTYRNCIYLMPNSGVKKLFFDISINSCGTTGNAQGTFYNEDVGTDNGLYFENTIIIQYDPQVQEAWDQARRLRCTWHDQYEKAVTFRPFPVDMLDVVRADFAGDNVGCWMQIQVGKGPWASEVAGIVKIGQTMTMVLAIKDEESKFDMLVRNCIAHDGKRSPIELVDGNGCIVRPKLMTKFTKIKNFGSSASVLAYTHFQAFKFPDSMEVHFQCTIQICRFQCPEQCTKQSNTEIINLYNEDGDNKRRKRRDLNEMIITGTLKQQQQPTTDVDKQTNEKEIGLNKAIQVVSPRDLSFPLEMNPEKMPLIGHNITSDDNDPPMILDQSSNVVCITTFSLILALIFLIIICFVCAIIFMMIMIRKKSSSSSSSKQSFDHHFHPSFFQTYFQR
ncbi:uncharacterized protein LOC113798930 isoform X1 [Dermatophagoides pteronyssinus]|uniref:uncharacterized protein LOC113798930 isoform X1 n=2 Tax=Dermatophagoides pteronyssinus TaxID=6956 RepID=UPI003F66C3C6